MYTEVKPEQKHQVIQDLQDKGHRVFMIGDGLNDSAALSKANVGVVMASSSDIARQASAYCVLRRNFIRYSSSR